MQTVRKYGFLFLLLPLMAIIQSCALVNEKFPEEIAQEKGDYYLTLTIFSYDATTRADDHDPEEEEDGSPAENYIDFVGGDYRIVLFNESGDFLADFGAENVNSSMAGTDNHTIEILIDRKKYPGFPVDSENLTFQVMVLANWNSWKCDYSRLVGRNISESDFNSIWKDGNSFNFSYNPDNNSWTPNIDSNPKRLIPMFGIGTISGFQWNSSKNIHYGHSTVWMLRSLAKIEISVSDEMFIKGFDIIECSINKYNTSGRLIPDLSRDENKFSGDQTPHMKYPSLSDSKQLTGGELKFVNLSPEGEKARFVAYLPEMATGEFQITDDDNDDRPKLEIKMAVNGKWFKDYNVELADYSKGKPVKNSYLFHVLRNHFYNYNIEGETGTEELKITYTVCPWTGGSADINFN